MSTPQQTVNLTSLLPASASAGSSSPNNNPTDDTVLQTLQARSRSDLPYTYLSTQTLIVVNPLRTLGNLSDASAQEYVEKYTLGPERNETNPKGKEKEGGMRLGVEQPHLYDLAGKVWSMMKRRKESQAIVYSGFTNSGKSFSSKLVTEQLLRFSGTTYPSGRMNTKDNRLPNQIRSLLTILDAFGACKTASNSSASQHGRYLELNFSSSGEGRRSRSDGRLIGGKVLTFGLNKTRMTKLERDERTFHVFYQLLAGAQPDEREELQLEGPDGYELLASSGCYRLPGGPFSDDSLQFDELRIAMANLGFKAKHLKSIFNILVTLLLLGNIEFEDGPMTGVVMDESATISHESRIILEQVAWRLGVPAEELEQGLTNETRYIRKELCSSFLDAAGAGRQRDTLVKDLYAILFAFVVETANRKIAPPDFEDEQEGIEGITTIVQMDLPGYQSKTSMGSGEGKAQSHQPLVNTTGVNSVDEFAINFSNELLHSYLTRRTFEDQVQGGLNSATVSDGIALPRVMTMDNSACVEMLRGGIIQPRTTRLASKPTGLLGVMDDAGVAIDPERGYNEITRQDEQLLADLTRACGVHASFVANPVTIGNAALGLRGSLTPQDGKRHSFGINHYAGPCTYDVSHFVEKNADIVDAQLVSMLRASNDSFIAKLVSGPSISAEGHPLDENTVVQAQVSVTPLREPTSSNGLSLENTKAYPLTTQLNATMTDLLGSLDGMSLWNVACIKPNDSGHPNSIDKRRVKNQIRSMLLPDMLVRKQVDYVASEDLLDFCYQHGLRYDVDDRNSIQSAVQRFAAEHGWTAGSDYAIGHQRLWLAYEAWRDVDLAMRAIEGEEAAEDVESEPFGSPQRTPYGAANSVEDGIGSLAGTPRGRGGYDESRENLLLDKGEATRWNSGYKSGIDSPGVVPHLDQGYPFEKTDEEKGFTGREAAAADMIVHEKGHHAEVETLPTTKARRWWVRLTWTLTWWIPSFLLAKVGRMKRPDVRMAWREKFAICLMIFLLCGIIIFYIIVFGQLLCPNMNKAWNTSQLTEHGDASSYYAAIHGYVYDFTKFYKGDHSDVSAYPTTSEIMLEFAGQDLTNYFPVPLTKGCPGLVNKDFAFTYANFTPTVAYAVHTSGSLQTENGTKLNDENWYYDRLQPFLDQRYKGQFVWSKNDIQAQADDSGKLWAVYENGLYDLSDYFNTVSLYGDASGEGVPKYDFLNSDITALIKQQPGQDLTKDIKQILDTMSTEDAQAQLTCLKNVFYIGDTDFRKEARCTVQNWLLLSFSIIMMSTVAAKFLAALQLGSKRQPELQDKFVLCQVPCYTEGEESLRRTIDTLAALNYDDKRKLIFIICDGNIIGSGNDRPTPRIVLDILGVDPKLDPEPLLFKSIGEGSRQLNYGKVYSGLYEFEGHVVPYMVIVKVGRPSERSKPGNRGKRDSQVLLLHYLNRVHFDAPMNPLELEIYHQMRNVIGIDPAFYEYIFQVDADTSVTPDSLNRMVACASDDSAIIGICGETKVANEKESFTTMIQVYEYYISHHLTKAFESLFGSVTCLPGCFSVYRIRTADKGRPIIISSRVIDEYAEPNVDTLHKKNLFSLGEDRYLTTLMMKHFPTFKMKFTPDAIAHTVAPSSWAVLLSQRRRWINSTIHNLFELLAIPEMCGFCFFSMRFVVFLDLLGTIILPATTIYLIYLIVVVASGKAAVPVIALAMIGAVYGLQAIIFILKREFMLIGWMVVYILAFPIFSFALPVYSFWNMDDANWGNTRVVVGEGKDKKVIADAEDHFDDSMIPLKRFSEYERETWEETGSMQAGLLEKESDAQSYASHDIRSRVHSRGPGSQAPPAPSAYEGDYYRDSSPMGRPSSQRNLRPMTSYTSMQSGMPQMQDPRAASMAGLGQWGAGSVYGMPPNPMFAQNPFMTASPVGSEHGGMAMGMNMGQSPYGMMGMMNTNGGPRNSVMTNLNDFAAPSILNQQPTGGSRSGLAPPVRPYSTFSMANTANPFGDAPPEPAPMNYASEPTEDEIIKTLKADLACQDLTTLTRRKVREGVVAKFPNADLSGKTKFINESVDRLLSEL